MCGLRDWRWTRRRIAFQGMIEHPALSIFVGGKLPHHAAPGRHVGLITGSEPRAQTASQVRSNGPLGQAFSAG